MEKSEVTSGKWIKIEIPLPEMTEFVGDQQMGHFNVRGPNNKIQVNNLNRYSCHFP